MRQGKLVCAVMLLVASMLGGLYLAGWLTLWLLDLKNSPLTWNTWWRYHQAANLPQYAPYAGKIKLAGGLGFGLPLLAWLLLLIPLSRRKVESLHGDARFASLSDLRKAGLLTQSPQGILIGKYRGRYLWLNGAQHAIAISPRVPEKPPALPSPCCSRTPNPWWCSISRASCSRPPAAGGKRKATSFACGRLTTMRGTP